MARIVLVVLSLFISFVAAHDSTCEVYIANGKMYNLTRYAEAGDQSYISNEDGHTYYWNLCSAVTADPCKTLPRGTASCQVSTSNPSSTAFPNGFQPPQISEYAVDDQGGSVTGITYVYSNDQRNCDPNFPVATTTLSFICDQNIPDWEIEYVREYQACQYFVIVHTSLACPVYTPTTPSPAPTTSPAPTPTSSPTAPSSTCERFVSPDTGNVYDLTAYAADDKWFISGHYNYSWNLCGNVSTQACQAFRNGAASCQVETTGESRAYQIGDQPPSVSEGVAVGDWIAAGVTYVYYNYQRYCSPQAPYTRTTLKLQCDESVYDWRTEYINETSTCNYEILVSSSYACPNYTPTTTTTAPTTIAPSTTTTPTTTAVPTSTHAPPPSNQRTCCLYRNSSGYRTTCTIDTKCSRIKGLKKAGSYHVASCAECETPQQSLASMGVTLELVDDEGEEELIE